MGFSRSNDPIHCVHRDVYVVSDDEILVGRGSGEYGGYVSFKFDPQGKALDLLVGNHMHQEKEVE